MRFLRWLLAIVGLLIVLNGRSLAQEPDRQVLVLEFLGGTDASGELIPRAHFFIEPESGAIGITGGWAYWEPQGGWLIHADAANIYRTHLLTGEQQVLITVPAGEHIVLPAVSPDGEWVAFGTLDADGLYFSAYAVRTDGSEQRQVWINQYAERVWSLGWSADGQAVEFELEPRYYEIAKFSVSLETGAVSVSGWYNVSPDSQWMAWQVQGYNYNSFVKNIATGETRQLPDRLNGSPTWTPDSQWLLYSRSESNTRQIYAERPDGSEQRLITPTPGHYATPWLGPENHWLYIEDEGEALYRIRADDLSTGLQWIANLPGEIRYRRWSTNVPGGPWLYFVNGYDSSRNIYRLNPDVGEVENLTNLPAAYSRIFWSPPEVPGGLWVYFMSNRDNVTAPADADQTGYGIYRMQPDGSEIALLTEPNLVPGGWHTAPKTVIRWSADFAWLEYGEGLAPTCRMRPDGAERVCLEDASYTALYESTTSPDGAWEVFVHALDESAPDNIFGLRADGGDLVNLTQQMHDASYTHLTWAPETVPGSPWLYFQSDLGGDWEIYRLNPDVGELENLTRDPHADAFSGPHGYDSVRRIWSPDSVLDGPWLYFLSDRAGGLDLYRMQPDGTQLIRLTHMASERLFVHWSPDEDWLIVWPGEPFNYTEAYRMRPDGSEWQQTIWISEPTESGNHMLRDEMLLGADRWLLVQTLDIRDCASWTFSLRAADSAEDIVSISLAPYLVPDKPCYLIHNVLNVGSRDLDGAQARVIWLPLIMDAN